MSDFCRVPEQALAMAAENICRWPDNQVPWTLQALLPGMTEQQMVDLLQPYFSKWKRVKVYYVERASQARVLVGARFIDGPNGVLADCYLPCGNVSQVKLQFDLGDNWTPAKLGQTAWHEFGHGIGISHAPAGSANIMAPSLNMNIHECGEWDLIEEKRRYPAAMPPPVPSPTGGSFMNFIWPIILRFAKDWLDRAIADGTVQKWLEELLRRFASGQVKNAEQLGEHADEALKVVAP